MCGRSLPLAGKEEQAEREQTEVVRVKRVRPVAIGETIQAPLAYRGTMLDALSFTSAATALCDADSGLAAIVERHGLPEFWAREPGLETLVLLILEQQVSLASARAAYDRLEQRLGGAHDRQASSPRATRSSAPTGSAARRRGTSARSRRRSRTVRWTSPAVATLDDDGVRTALVALPGIGPWTADVYLLSALRRPDVWPVGDIALQEAARRVRDLELRPTPPELEALGEVVAAPSRERRPAPLASVPQRAEALVSICHERSGERWHSRQLKERHAAMWGSAPFERIAATLADMHHAIVDAVQRSGRATGGSTSAAGRASSRSWPSRRAPR